MTQGSAQNSKLMLLGSLVEGMSICQAFMQMWQAASAWLPSELAISDVGRMDRKADLDELLETGAPAFVQSVIGHLSSETGAAEIRGVILDAMSVIDMAFLRIHPRSVILSSKAGVAVKIPEWLLDFRRKRLETGKYACSEQSYLIPRGPLCRRSRGDYDCSGESLLDRFSALSVVPKVLHIHGTPFDIDVRVLAPGVDNGVSAMAEQGKEKVAAIPVGIEKEHIKFDVAQRYSSYFARYSASSQINVVESVIASLQACGAEADIAVASEFFVSEEAADEIVQKFHEIDDAPSVFVAGSGNTLDQQSDQSWNESRVYNSLGIELWRQRKLWPSGINLASAQLYGMSTVTSGPVKEDNASGDHVVVMDLDGVGRCVVLICQDLQAPTLAEDLIINYQPDWVFVPILDTNANPGRWGHQRSFALSNKSQAKFIIVTSSALGKYNPSDDDCFAMLVGPMDPKDNDTPRRAYALLREKDFVRDGYAAIQWGVTDPRWHASKLV